MVPAEVLFKELLIKVSSNKCGTTLDLSRKTLGYIIEGDENIKALADALIQNTTITSLNLYGQNIGSTSLSQKEYRLETFGPKYFAEVLKKNKTITSINLARNHIGAEGIGYILDGLKENTVLVSLDLTINPFLREGPLSSWQKSEGILSLSEENMNRVNAFLERNRKIKEKAEPVDQKTLSEMNAEISQKNPYSLAWTRMFENRILIVRSTSNEQSKPETTEKAKYSS